MGYNLLTIMAQLENLVDNVMNFFTNFQVIYGAEMVLFFALIFLVSKVLRDNNATKLMIGYWILILVGGAWYIFDEALMTRNVYFFYIVLISAFMLILFNVEIKKSVWDVQKAREHVAEKTTGNTEIRTKADTERCIDNIIKALQNMSKNNVGSLIVLSKGNLPKQVLQSGVSIEAEISTQLIEGIFFPKAPLHDGALVINGHKIQSAGCFLPLTQKTSYPKEYGTRHRAAIGITEVANVISLVVSEETGIISIVKQGHVTRYADYEMLMDALRDYYWQEMPLTDKKRAGK